MFLGWLKRKWYEAISRVAVDPIAGTFYPKPEPIDPLPIKPVKPKAMADINKWKGIIIEGSTFPDDPYKIVPVKLNSSMTKEYLPALERALVDEPTGMKLLCTVMAHVEGFRPGTRSYKNNNPGNIGNTDSGANVKLPTLEAGIKKQAEHIYKIIDGKSKPYPMGKPVTIPPFFSKEIQNNLKNYGAKSGYVPGYKFTFTGQLDQFVKIYASLPRVNNSYLNQIVSYFAANGLQISAESKLQDIIKMGQ